MKDRPSTLWRFLLSSFCLLARMSTSRASGAPDHLLRRPQCTADNIYLTERSILQRDTALQDFLITLPQIIRTGTWLQIGANTLDPLGSTYQVEDPLLHYLPLYSAYRKVLVEPIPPLFEQLRENTRHLPNTELVNAAIVPEHEVANTVTMYCPLEEEMVDWLVGICSLDEEIITSHTNSGRSRSFQVPALNVNGLLRTYNVQDVRVVMIDAAGLDVKILKMLPFHKVDFQPEIVVFEHTEVSIDEYEEAKEILRLHCYSLAYDRENTYALRLF